MALPKVAGWLIDYRTARAIFASGSNQRIDHCVGMCQSKMLFLCHCEEQRFRDTDALRATFIDDQNCVFDPDDTVMAHCMAVSMNPVASRLIVGNDAAIFITSIAATKNFGVISDHRSPGFTTVYDLCATYGVPVFSADEYFALA